MKSRSRAVARICSVPVALLKSFDLAPQNNGQAKIALSGFVNQLATLYDASLRQRLEQRKLAIVQFWKGDTCRVAIKLFVSQFVGCHCKHLTRCDEVS